MKYPVLLLSLMLAMPLSGQARSPSAPPPLDDIVQQLQLDAGQAARLKEMVKQHHQAMHASRQQKKQLRESIHQMRDQHREQLLTLLNHEQLYQFDQYMREQRKQHRAARSDGQ